MSEPQLPPDNHVHTQWSWDAVDRGSMQTACERAIELNLPSIAFTEHVDLTPWAMPDPFPTEGWLAAEAPHVQSDGCLHAPALDLDGYFESIERCRATYPNLRILTGLEIGEPHWNATAVDELLARGTFERVLGSLHSLVVDGRPRLLDEWFYTDDVTGAAEQQAVRDYLAETIVLVGSSDHFEVFAHIDYLTRQIVRGGNTHDPADYEDEYRQTLKAIASAGRVLEINTRLGLDPRIVDWWREEGGQAVSFGSDAHEGPLVGGGFVEASAMAEAAGFKRQPDPQDFWRRS